MKNDTFVLHVSLYWCLVYHSVCFFSSPLSLESNCRSLWLYHCEHGGFDWISWWMPSDAMRYDTSDGLPTYILSYLPHTNTQPIDTSSIGNGIGMVWIELTKTVKSKQTDVAPMDFQYNAKQHSCWWQTSVTLVEDSIDDRI